MNTARFSRDDRLTKPAEFERVFKAPVRDTSKYFTVLACENNHTGPRLGLAIAKKTVHLAVARNRIKRLIRESFRHHHQQLDRLDIVVMARRGADQASRATLRDTLQQHWKRLAQLCAN